MVYQWPLSTGPLTKCPVVQVKISEGPIQESGSTQAHWRLFEAVLPRLCQPTGPKIISALCTAAQCPGFASFPNPQDRPDSGGD
jgi:hypothetical protein